MAKGGKNCSINLSEGLLVNDNVDNLHVTRCWERGSSPLCLAPRTLLAPVNCRAPLRAACTLGGNSAHPRMGGGREVPCSLVSEEIGSVGTRDDRC